MMIDNQSIILNDYCLTIKTLFIVYDAHELTTEHNQALWLNQYHQPTAAKHKSKHLPALMIQH